MVVSFKKYPNTRLTYQYTYYSLSVVVVDNLIKFQEFFQRCNGQSGLKIYVIHQLEIIIFSLLLSISADESSTYKKTNRRRVIRREFYI